MRYYPIFVNLQGKRCLVVGAGQVGQRKITGLATSGAAEILVLDPGMTPALAEALGRLPAVRLAARDFTPDDLDGRFLVIAATDDEALNWTISRECAHRGILCNIVDQPEKCSFIVPALYTQGDRSEKGDWTSCKYPEEFCTRKNQIPERCARGANL